MKTFFFFFLESTCALCPWSLALASSIPVLGLESVCPRKGCPWPWPRIFFVSLALALASSLVSSTPPLTPITGCFQDKTIIYKENNRVNCDLLLKYCWRDCTLLPPIWAKSLIKFKYKMQDFKRVLDLNCKQ